MNPSTACATVLVDELIRLGCRHAVLCPGSRSAPLAYALAEADAAGRLTLHVRVDERSAAFLALGLGKGGASPVPVVTTSGTAAAELHPAVLEAYHDRVPLLLLTADRPPELRGTGANQTTDQVKLFGGAVRWQHDLGTPERRPGQQVGWRTTVDRAWAAALGDLGGDPGPVHLNVPFRDPLAPDLAAVVAPGPDGQAGPDVGAERGADPASVSGAAAAGPAWPEPLAGRAGGEPWTRTGDADRTPWWSVRASSGVDALPDVPRTLVVLGDLDAPAASRQVLRLAQVIGWPVLAEPFGRRDAGAPIPHAPLVAGLPGLLDALGPERILLVGRLSLTRALAGLLRDHAAAGGAVEQVTRRTAWPDPGHVVTRVHPWAAVTARDHLGRERVRAAADDDWYAGWQELGTRVAAAVEPLLAWPGPGPSETPTGIARPGDATRSEAPTGPALAAAVLTALPADATLFVGSSTAARDVDLARGSDDLAVVGSRGLAGIDGCVSTAAGMALAGRAMTYALVGDLTFLHDTNALLIGPQEPRPDLTVVVANDDGGAIFATLEYGETGRERHHERVFATPTGTDLAALCAAHGVPHRRVTEPAALAEALGSAPRGLRVVEVPIARGSHRATYAALRQAAASAAGWGEAR